MTQKTKPTDSLPIFYVTPEPLSSERHAGWRMKEGDMTFAAKAACVPLMLSEFAIASRDFPVLFAEANAAPITLLGLEADNLFVENGRWAEDVYIPAYVRRYPFTMVRANDANGFVMVIDAASDRIARDGDEGVALFEDGQPSAFTRQVVTFCEHFHADALATEAFSAALKTQNLLIDRRADITLPDGGKMGVNGFQVIDRDRFATLDDAVVLDWHRKGWLALVHFHLASLDRFQNLMHRRAARQMLSPKAA